MRTTKVLTAGAAAALLLAACGDSATDQSGTADDANAEDLGAEEDDIVLTFWHGLGGDNEEFINDELAAKYSEETDGVVVNAQMRGTYNEVLDQSIVAAGTDEAPHIVQLYEIGVQLARDSGIFAPIHELDTEGIIDPDDYVPAVSSYYTDETGDLYSAPWNSSNPIVYINRDLFEEAGLDPDDPPERFSEVLDACEQIMDAGVSDACFGMPIHSWFFEQTVAQQGGLLANNDNGRSGRATEVLLDSPEAVNVLEFWQEMDERGYWLTSGAREDWDDPRTLMANGQIAMAMDSTAAVGTYEASLEELGNELGTAFMPIPDDAERHGTVIGGASLYILDGHSEEETQAALEFVNWLSEEQQDIAWHQFTGYFPVRSDTNEALDAEGWWDENPNFATAVQQLEETTVTPATQGAVMGPFPEIREIVLDAVEETLFEGTDPADALSANKERADAALEEYNADVEGS
ncbi:ABC transporter substrate-binding protein [Actinobacteria bacterium YIM 96077]|uniref:ABC transporter substrate-binding protein n=1 Tax=Phytoactinopolyspora halophila TaxID=1981511 RepID=A0A329QL49_9ACTN|nr:ABC transporter substrate-binding protein [Phytoactinopolyspora halophila]AYY14841.1 ABC transporter substrate-binding protein [Actinobacteria bacterium YIM 96077]RAW13115.1 ABC transporter substrate-binding protein [Phytoactinopolyspora halophila]